MDAMKVVRRLLLAPLLGVLACTARSTEPPTPTADYLYVWTASADSTRPDFLAVLDVTEDSARYGRLVTTLPVPGLGNRPHHTEHEMPADRQLFANGFASGQSFIFDLRDPAAPAPGRPVRRRRGLRPPALVPAAPRRCTCSRPSRCGTTAAAWGRAGWWS